MERADRSDPAAVAVDRSGDLYIADDKGSQVLEFGPEGARGGIHNHKGDLSKEMGSIAVDSSGDIYVGGFALPVNELDPQGELIHQLGGRTFAVAVDQATIPNEVYVDESASKAEHHEQIAEYNPPVPRSVTTLPGPPGSEAFYPGLGVDPGSGRIYAAAGGVLKLQGARGVLILGADIVQPDVATEPATAINTTGATLHGTVEPDLAHDGGDVSSCDFEYVSEQAFQAHGYEHAAAAACEASRPLPYPEREPVSATVSLSPSTTDHYRLAAADAAFPTEANDGDGEARPEESLTTLGPPSRRIRVRDRDREPRHAVRADRPARLQHDMRGAVCR